MSYQEAARLCGPEINQSASARKIVTEVSPPSVLPKSITVPPWPPELVRLMVVSMFVTAKAPRRKTSFSDWVDSAGRTGAGFSAEAAGGTGATAGGADGSSARRATARSKASVQGASRRDRASEVDSGFMVGGDRLKGERRPAG